MSKYFLTLFAALTLCLTCTGCETVYHGEMIEEKIREEYGIAENTELLDGGLIGEGDDCVFWHYTAENDGTFTYYPTAFHSVGRARYTFTGTLNSFNTAETIVAVEYGGVRQIFMNDPDCAYTEMVYKDGRTYREEILGTPVLYAEKVNGTMYHAFYAADGTMLTYEIAYIN